MQSFKFIFLLLISILHLRCHNPASDSIIKSDIELIVLGIAQDAGYPQANCQKVCCQKFYDQQETKKHVSCLGIIDHISNSIFILDATPDFPYQLQLLKSFQEDNRDYSLDGIAITHAHIGHYTGLMHLGREAMGASNIPVFAMPRFKAFLENNGPWSQLVDLKNINIQTIKEDSVTMLNEHISLTPMLVPHRDEYSETVGFMVETKNKKALFIPDIDKWSKWNRSIDSLIQIVDFAFLDGTFYDNGELPNRDMSEIPHPFIEESIWAFSTLSLKDKEKIHFIHFNHTNPVLFESSAASKNVSNQHFALAREGNRFALID